MKLFIIILLSAILLSCSNDPIEKISSNNSSFDVYLLFEVDGCKVYRFTDGGRDRYFTNCQGSIGWNESHGKNNNVDVEIQTNKLK